MHITFYENQIVKRAIVCHRHHPSSEISQLMIQKVLRYHRRGENHYKRIKLNQSPIFREKIRRRRRRASATHNKRSFSDGYVETHNKNYELLKVITVDC